MSVSKATHSALAAVLLLAAGSLAQTVIDRETLRWINQEPKITRIEITGNEYFSDAKIKKILFSREYGFFSNIKNSRNVRLRRETLVRDTSAIKGLYLQHGFLAVRVTEIFEREEDTSAIIKIDISEGALFRLGALKVNGEVPQEFARQIGNVIKDFKPGQPVSPFRLRQITSQIKEIFANNGYPYARIGFRADTSLSSDSVRVEFDLVSDSLVHFGNVRVQGADLYGEHAALRELKIKPGRLYRRRDIQDSQRRLLRSGYFTTIQLRASDSAALGTAYNRYRPDFSLAVKERNAHFVNIRTGVAPDSIRDFVGELQLGIGKRNMFETRRLETSVNGVFAFEGRAVLSYSFGARYFEPWFLGFKVPLSLSAEFEPGVRSQIQPFRVQRWRIDVETIWQSNVRRRFVTGAQYENVDIFNVDSSAAFDPSKVAGITIRRRLFAAYRRDTKDDIFVPKRGAVVEAKLDYFGGILGGDVSFFRVEAGWSKFQPFWKNIIRASRIKFGFAEPLGSDDEVPSIDRFFIGGASTIRGFSTRELGPGGGRGEFSEGAEFYIIFNQELRIPIYGRFWGELFFDAGNGWRGLDDPNISFNGAAYSYGIGAQYHSPAGPLRLDYARRVRTKGITNIPGPDDRFHFTILYAF
ncbi:MAG: BamA/TamA family outer membrane protein [candidate division Zixibacteria bacterium]|nr:BamA/TamA family outer membrane protein [candidate division Zixibacteria bacterium]